MELHPAILELKKSPKHVIHSVSEGRFGKGMIIS
jgi:hypothetical protein